MRKSIKRIFISFLTISALSLTFVSCSKDDPEQQVIINMLQFVNNQALEMNTVDMPYTNKRGHSFNVSKLRYLISGLYFQREDGSTFELDDYFLVDASDQSTLAFTPTTKIPNGKYTSVGFYFGFNEEDNIDGVYSDLNTLNWNWPAMLGGGYHNMQFEGMYDSAGTSKPFATHMGTARNMSVSPTQFLNNAVEIKFDNIDLIVNGEFSLDITMNIEQWYENPFEWDFTVWNVPIMPIFEAQQRLNDNASSVFSISVE